MARRVDIMISGVILDVKKHYQIFGGQIVVDNSVLKINNVDINVILT